MAQISEMTRARQKSLPWRLIGMSFSEVFLGGLLSSRARLRFPRYTRSAARECCSSRKLQRTATVELHNCLKKGRSPSHKDQEFLADLVTHLRPDLVESARRILEDPYPGYDIGRKKVGCLFPDYVVMSNLQGLRYDDELKL